MMFKSTLLLLVALSLVVSIDAITAPATHSAVKLPALGGKYDKRSLRGFMASDATATEERGPAEAAQKLKTMLSRTKLGEKIAAIQKARLGQREEFVKKLVADGANWETLLKHKVTGKEIYKARDISSEDVLFGHLLSPNYVQAKAYAHRVEIFGKQYGIK
ncbi:hypothetical protein PF008_g16919 [Phytophthora fragariae]|uniref:RxLR effector protein n=1 Tax=Phytophthora fragariae TaxID=53985 RepID=A0A6G0R9Q7_9STRA|nr:hypothetical protein PF008_g16919 [Phytophthora fragariae]